MSTFVVSLFLQSCFLRLQEFRVAVHTIMMIAVRTSWRAARLSNYTLYVGNTHPALDSTFWTQASICAYVAGTQPQVAYTHYCTSAITGRYLAIRLGGTDYLQLANVEVNNPVPNTPLPLSSWGTGWCVNPQSASVSRGSQFHGPA